MQKNGYIGYKSLFFTDFSPQQSNGSDVTETGYKIGYKFGYKLVIQ